MSSKKKYAFGFILVAVVFSTSGLMLLSLDATKIGGAAVVGAANIVGAFGVIIAIITVYAQSDQAKAQRYYDLMERYVDDDFKMAERYLKTRFESDLRAGKFDFSQGFASCLGTKVTLFNQPRTAQIDYEISYIIQVVSNFYSNLGILAAYDIIDKDIIYMNLGSDILLLWNHLAPIIKAQDDFRRARRDREFDGFHPSWKTIPYQAGFAYLVEDFKQAYPSTFARRLMNSPVYPPAWSKTNTQTL